MHRNITFRRLALDLVQFVRTQRPVTRLLGPQFGRSHRYVEIDITYRCNLRCPNCNRSCTQAPSRMDMPVATVSAFLEDSVRRGIRWARIRLLGGEPALHPQLDRILTMIMVYRDRHSPGTRIVLCTNGAGRQVRAVLARLPEGTVIKSTDKGARQRLFRPFNMAPVDSTLYRLADYSAGCRIIDDCGLGLTPLGYYPCAVAGGIDRVFGLGKGKHRLPLRADGMRDQMRVLCRYCGHFGFRWPTRRQQTSPAWRAAYKRYRKRGQKDC
jgi:Radical SAM superfamily